MRVEMARSARRVTCTRDRAQRGIFIHGTRRMERGRQRNQHISTRTVERYAIRECRNSSKTRDTLHVQWITLVVNGDDILDDPPAAASSSHVSSRSLTTGVWTMSTCVVARLKKKILFYLFFILFFILRQRPASRRGELRATHNYRDTRTITFFRSNEYWLKKKIIGFRFRISLLIIFCRSLFIVPYLVISDNGL